MKDYIFYPLIVLVASLFLFLILYEMPTCLHRESKYSKWEKTGRLLVDDRIEMSRTCQICGWIQIDSTP